MREILNLFYGTKGRIIKVSTNITEVTNNEKSRRFNPVCEGLRNLSVAASV